MKLSKADRMVSAYAILHDARCLTCGAMNETLQPGHYFHRTRASVRWDLRNVYLQCASCNAKHNNNPEVLRRVVVKRLGEEGLEKLERDSNVPYTEIDIEWTADQILEIIYQLPRWVKLSAVMQGKIFKGRFTNKELIRAIHGY